MGSITPVFIVLAVILGIYAVVWAFTPKGPHQTLIRTCIMLTLACCYLMWMATYLAQLHPLEYPRKTLHDGATE